MHIQERYAGKTFAPLEQVTLLGASTGTVTVEDGLGRIYTRLAAQPELTFTIAGAVGNHIITATADDGQSETLTIKVNSETSIRDENEEFSTLLSRLFYTMLTHSGDFTRWNGRIYYYFVCWLRDHVHVLKGMKYFAERLQSAIDLYRESQREDGMIWDNVYPRTPDPNYWDVRFEEGNFIRPFDDYTSEFKRIPVENDVEYLFVEGLYYTWKATGDDGWMAANLDAAMRALDYSVTDRYRWSEKYQLLKRGYTIDTWDFQNDEDSVVAHDPMRIDPEKTQFGVMFGDNTGYAMSCHYLAEMLKHAGRDEEAQRYLQREQEIRQRLDALSWNGRFFTHHIPEHPERNRDLGVDEATQVSLSNAYSLNRGLTHEQCVEIIKTYQEIKTNLPEGSPGEWYTIYPPFGKGFGSHNSIWQYMNAGVTPIVAGELAHGAFEHGYEGYGVDILRRLLELSRRYGNQIHSTYTGSIAKEPERTFRTLDISAYANIDFKGTDNVEGVPGWTGEGKNDLHEMTGGKQLLEGIPFAIPDPETNGRRGCIGMWSKEGYAQQVEITVNQPAGSIYFLHTTSGTNLSPVAGTITFHYANGTTFSRYVVREQNVSGWWIPSKPQENSVIAWRGKNATCPYVGLTSYGIDNPHPKEVIERITLTASADGSFWAICGITLGDQALYTPVSPISYGIPDSWGAAAVVYALVEGLAGVVDTGTTYSSSMLAPRWTAADVSQAAVTIAYPESGGYVAYTYAHVAEHHTITLQVTGSGETCHCHILLPEETGHVLAVTSNEQALDFQLHNVEYSQYVDFTLSLPGPHTVSINYTQ